MLMKRQQQDFAASPHGCHRWIGRECRFGGRTLDVCVARWTANESRRSDIRVKEEMRLVAGSWVEAAALGCRSFLFRSATTDERA